MKPVFQTIIDGERGDCHRAAIASLFELEPAQVPHFRLYPARTWFAVYYHFLLGLGYEFKGTAYPERHATRRNYDGVKGYYLAIVPSKTFPGKTHCVLINEFGGVAHDPNPNQLWKGINVIETGDLLNVDIIEPIGNHA